MAVVVGVWDGWAGVGLCRGGEGVGGGVGEGFDCGYGGEVGVVGMECGGARGYVGVVGGVGECELGGMGGRCG